MKVISGAFTVIATICLLGIDFAEASSQRAVKVGGSVSALIMPKGKPRASVILMAGGHGRLGVTSAGRITRLRGNQLVRTRHAYARRGRAVLVLDSGASLAAAVKFMAKIRRPVTVIATSRGTLRAARGIRAGARPNALVLTAGMLTPASGGGSSFSSILGSPKRMPRTLVIHHRDDACHVTLPKGVRPFIRWARGKARAVWLSGGRDVGHRCRARSHHGFNGLDGKVVSLAAGFR